MSDETRWPDTVAVVDVAARDGLQNDAADIDTKGKVDLIQSIASAGVTRIECTSFVNPRVVPKMSDADDVSRRLHRDPKVQYAALVANRRGLERALAAKMDVINLVVVASETFNIKNANRSVADSMSLVEDLARSSMEASAIPSVIIGTAFHCPFEGPVAIERVLALIEQCVSVGVREVTLADTIGAADPSEVSRLGARAASLWPELELGLHLHDTRGLALANAAIAVQAGYVRLEASLGGLGGCPFAPGAAGNVATEDLVFMLHSMGIKTGIDLERLIQAASGLEKLTGRELNSHMLRAGPRQVVSAN